nr:PREDICTED: EF-hand calcium-binding domain-containing protein 8 isoform X2 [Anolis carolinensis]|eukprot:XP_016854020.1 PREDICTED: EF-hand calcium-binding domain-containing protein 8 isoform X2 [Anolis carolinensis]
MYLCIYFLTRDVKEHDKVIESKHWKSYHCDDILCMDGHKSKLLATASCNGDIVLWNVHSGQAFCRFNASESPLVLQPKRAAWSSEAGGKSAHPPQTPSTGETSAPKKDPQTWQEGVSAPLAAVEKIWDIMNYCTQSNSEASLHVPDDESMEENDFCYLIPEYCRIPARYQTLGVTQEVYQGWVTTLVPPTCLNSWRGHLKNVVSIRYVDRYRSILTASHDCTVKLWMLTGKHIGTFGQSLWRLGVQHLIPAHVPEEIRRVASLHTMKVLNEGRQPHWESTRNIVHALGQQKRQQSVLLDFLHVKSGSMGDTASKMRQLIQKETRIAKFTEEEIEATFQKWEESGKKKSEILGYAYKQKVHRPMLTQLPEVKTLVANKEHPRIYHCIQFTNLHPVNVPEIPKILLESQLIQGMDQRPKKGKKWSAVSSLIKPTLKSYMMRHKMTKTSSKE